MIYIIRCGDAVKVGFSSDPFTRIKELQTGNPQRLEVIAVFPGSRKLEKGIHARLNQYRISGEWFRWTPEVVNALESVKVSLGDLQSSDITPPPISPVSGKLDEVNPESAELIAHLSNKAAELEQLPVLFDRWLHEEVSGDRVRYRLRWRDFGKLKSLELSADDAANHQIMIRRGQMLSHIDALIKLLKE